jgi:hypothetical protein
MTGLYSNGSAPVYVDGPTPGQGPIGAVASVGGNATHLTAGYDPGGSLAYFTGTVSEIRISKIARSLDWVATEHNNLSSPGTFYSVVPQWRQRSQLVRPGHDFRDASDGDRGQRPEHAVYRQRREQLQYRRDVEYQSEPGGASPRRVFTPRHLHFVSRDLAFAVQLPEKPRPLHSFRFVVEDDYE